MPEDEVLPPGGYRVDHPVWRPRCAGTIRGGTAGWSADAGEVYAVALPNEWRVAQRL